MTYCAKCGGVVPDIGLHQCPTATITYKPNSFIHSSSRCGICGSTAIDHTEADCQRNQKRNGGLL